MKCGHPGGGGGGGSLRVTELGGAAVCSTTLLMKIGLTVQAAVLRTNEGADAVRASLWLSFRAHGALLSTPLKLTAQAPEHLLCARHKRPRDGKTQRFWDLALESHCSSKSSEPPVERERVTSFPCDSRQCIYIQTSCGI